MSKTKRPTKRLLAQEVTVEAFLADSVVTAPDNKMYVQGGAWNMIQTPVLPFRISRLGVALIMSIPYELATPEPITFTLRLENADGIELPLGDAPQGTITADGKLHRVGGQLNIGRPPGIEQGDEQMVPVAINFDGLVFTEAGVYCFIVEVGGRDIKRLRFRVNQLVQHGFVVS